MNTDNLRPQPVEVDVDRSRDSEPGTGTLTPLSAVRYDGEQYKGKTNGSGRYYDMEGDRDSSDEEEGKNEDVFHPGLEPDQHGEDGGMSPGKVLVEGDDFDPERDDIEYKETRDDIEYHRRLHRHTLTQIQLEESKHFRDKAIMDHNLVRTRMDLQERQRALDAINQVISDLQESTSKHESMIAEKQEGLKFLIEKQEKETVKNKEDIDNDYQERKVSERKSISELQQSIVMMNRVLKEQKEKMEADIKQMVDEFQHEKEHELEPEMARWAEANRKNQEILDLIEQVKQKYQLSDGEGEQELPWSARQKKGLIQRVVDYVDDHVGPRSPTGGGSGATRSPGGVGASPRRAGPTQY
mmetsp:Transcript_4519/g.7751  ORF Transcript_4519/g.7751 Transcript_4519/m.7751 type:complete len:355 (+) Transcript_4519:123-1187(+)